MIASLAFALLMGSLAQEVVFKGSGGLAMQGTLELPVGRGPFNAVLLLPGSGPTDRNGNQPPGLITDLLKQVAEDLSAHGVASFRFDKRAAHVHAADWPKAVADMNEFFSWENFVGDAQLALKTLRSRPEVDPKKVSVLGHSEGGLIALQLGAMLATADKPFSLVLVGTPGRNMADIVRNQISDALHQQTQSRPVIDSYMAATEKAITQITTSATVPDDTPAGLKGLFNPTAAKLMQSYFKLDPSRLAAAFPGAVLVMNGQFDNQVSATKDTPLLEAAFKARQSGALKAFIVPNASHNLKHVESMAGAGFTGPVEPSALRELSSWMAQN